MRRALLASVAALTLLGVAGPAVAAGVEDDDKHLCVMTDTETREGYCVKTQGLPIPTVAIPKLPELP